MTSHALLALALAAPTSGQAPIERHRPLADAPKFVAEAKALARTLVGKEAIVPGFGLAVVVEDRIVLADGFGAADLEKPVAADGDTVYYIASATKPFTALMASLLDARGEFELGSSLADHLDEGMLDPKLGADEILLRDLLCHTSGLENGPIVFRLAYSGEHDAPTLWRLVGQTTANDRGRGRFRYTNYGYNLLTILLERELGRKWQDLLQEVVFAPLGLEHTSAYTSVPRAKGHKVAAPYRLEPEGLKRLALEKADAQMQSAGGMVTSPRDAARWLSFQLNAGVLDGRAVVDPVIVRETQKAWIEIPPKDRGEGDAIACGGGWQIADHGGERALQHGGGYAGFRSAFSFLPEARVGVAVLTNADVPSDVCGLLREWSYDWWLGRDLGGYAARVKLMEAQREVARAEAAKVRDSMAKRTWDLTRERPAYAGSFANESLGTLVFAVEGDSIRARLGLLACIGTPYPEADSVRLEFIPGSGRVAVFHFDASGRALWVNYDGNRFDRAPR